MPLDAQRFFLTYSAITVPDFNENTLADFLNGKNHFDWAEVNHEHHQDGGDHYHAVVTFTRRYRGSMSSFDFLGIHPNIKPIKSGRLDLKRCREYIRKDGIDRLVTAGEAPEIELDDATSVNTTERNRWGQLLDSASQQQFLDNAASWFPKEFILRHHDILAFAHQHFNSPSEYVPEFPRDSFTVPEQADEWVTQVLGEVSSGSLTRTSLDL